MMMGKIKETFKLLVVLDKLNQELNGEVNTRIKELKAQIKEKEKNPKYWKPVQ